MPLKKFLKVFFLLILIAVCGLFVYLKLQILGDPNSIFNQTTRFKLGSYPLVRTILGLHEDGDARMEYLSAPGPIVIEWFKPQLEDIDQTVLQKFADLVAKYTGRPTKLVEGGGVSDSTVQLSDLKNLQFSQIGEKGSLLYVVFATDFSPRTDTELASTYNESYIVLSLSSHKNFLQAYSQAYNEYILSSLLHEFGHQIGLEHNDDPSCIMAAHAGISGQPEESFGKKTPQDFCPAEQQQIQQLKLQY